MANQHAKCPRCERRGTRWGNRRRRCEACSVTWRIRKKKRGRKRIRSRGQQAIRYLHNREPNTLRFTDATRSYRRVLSRNRLMKNRSWPTPPQTGPLILIADAFLQWIENSWYTWYCIFVRTSDGEDATILPPFCRRGTEVPLGWQEAFAALPHALLAQCVALVCDGHNGLIIEARRRGWFIQRCHFHLLARLQSHRSRWRQGQHQKEGEEIHKAVVEILTAPAEKISAGILSQLALLGRATTSREVCRVILGLLTNHREYRTYLQHPELHLPTTNNTAEAFIGLLRKICQRAHGFRTLQSLNAWIEAFIKVQKTMKCRGKTNRII